MITKKRFSLSIFVPYTENVENVFTFSRCFCIFAPMPRGTSFQLNKQRSP